MKITFVSSNDTQVKTFAPVMEDLKKIESVHIQTVSLDLYKLESSERMLKEKRIPYVTLRRSYQAGRFGSIAWPEYLNTLAEARNRIHSFLLRERPDIIVMGNDIGDCEQLFVKNAALRQIPSLLIQDGVMARTHSENLKGSITADLGMSSFAIRARRTIKRVAQNCFNGLGILSYVQKVMVRIGRLPLPARELPTAGLPYGHCGCTKIAVYGAYARGLFISQGIDADKIIVTGQPRYDNVLSRRKGINRAEVLKELDLATDKRIILYTSVAFAWYATKRDAEVQALMSCVLDGTRSLSRDYRLVVKLHPRENAEGWSAMIGRGNTESVVVKDYDVWDLLAACDIMITTSSTTILEAMLFDKPVITLNFCYESDYGTSHNDTGAAIACDEPKYLAACIQKALFDEQVREEMSCAQKQFLSEHLHKMDGQASKRVAGVILDMIGKAT